MSDTYFKPCALALKSKKLEGKFGKRLFWHYCLKLYFIYKAVSQISFNCSVREIENFYQSSLGNEVDFRDIMNISPNIVAKN